MKLLLSVCFFPLILTIHPSFSYMIGNNPYHRSETLDSQGKYRLDWLVNHDIKIITFNVTVETTGFVGFGLSQNGKMSGADIVVGGVRNNGKKYFSDRHVVGGRVPQVDVSQDWNFHFAQENGTHTFLSFSRAFDTCDPQDYPITEDSVALIWSYGERDVVEYHHQNRGVFTVYLLHGDYSPPIVQNPLNNSVSINTKDYSDVKVWTINYQQLMPVDDTTYWCRMYDAPKLQKKHHIIGYQARFSDDISKRHIHHILVFKCNAPAGTSAKRMFDSYIRHPGQECLGGVVPQGPILIEYCTELSSAWAIGGRPFFNPPHIGFPFGEDPDEYYVVQYHLDNPNRLSNVVLDVKLDYFYTDKLRENDGGFMNVGHTVPGAPGSILVPPSSTNHAVSGSCGSTCTSLMFPQNGISVYGYMFHTHHSGVKARYSHFRNGTELPWIANDDNYSNQYQQFNPIKNEVKVMPGDMLTTRCVYDNTWTNHTVVGRLTTQQEMCGTITLYHTKIPNHSRCSSEINSETFRQRFLGVNNFTWSREDIEFVVTSPSNLTGLTITEVSDNHIRWNLARRQELQRAHMTHSQVGVCPRNVRDNNDAQIYREIIDYVEITNPYKPDKSCSFQSNRRKYKKTV